MITKNNEKKCCGIEFYPPQKKKQKKNPFRFLLSVGVAGFEPTTLRRQLPPEIRKHLMAYYPEYITDRQQAYTYLAQHYGIFE